MVIWQERDDKIDFNKNARISRIGLKIQRRDSIDPIASTNIFLQGVS